MKPRANGWALLPVAVFLVLYLGLGILLEYGLGAAMGFDSVPISAVFLAAILVACLQNRQVGFEEKLSLMAGGVGDKNIITMILIFLAAGIFVGVTGRDSAEAVAYFMLSVTPPNFAVAILFVVSCFVSTAMGTSCGTITLMVPVAAAVSDASGFSLPLCMGTVMGGAMFGDNLSIISDTTIAACSTQGCQMKDKFWANFKIAIPAAAVTLGVVLVMTAGVRCSPVQYDHADMILLLPYLLVLVTGLLLSNVFVVLLIGIVSGSVIGLATGRTAPLELLAGVSAGTSEMFETIVVTLLVSALCGMIRAYGGFEALLVVVRRIFRGSRGGQLGIGLLVGIMDVATASNTVAIVMAGPIAKEISRDYGISPKRTASILDTFSCIFQGLLPYGAQMLLTIAAVRGLGYSLSAFAVLPYLLYHFFLAVSSFLYIVIGEKKEETAQV